MGHEEMKLTVKSAISLSLDFNFSWSFMTTESSWGSETLLFSVDEDEGDLDSGSSLLGWFKFGSLCWE